MATLASNPIVLRLHEHRGMLFPLGFISLLLVILVPMPPAVMDVLLIVNLAISAIILVTTIYIQSPLEFSVFPSLLLAATLFRLVLSAATTRLILTVGAGNQSVEQAMHGAGEVILTFANFVAGGSLAVGVIIFVIIFVIQFVVITKGSTRISEVAARFVLDAMPGKQMAIDADVNAGLINEAEAQRRRAEISQEADFYGAMDGAGRFVRGDAIAGIIIVLVNILGGIYVGMVENGWELGQCLKLYTKLTIGDGLVSQVPAFLVSLAAGLIVTRSSGRTNLGEDVLSQMVARPKALIITAIFLGMMMFTAMPKVPLLLTGACCGGLAWVLTRRERRQQAAAERAALATEQAARKEPEKVEKLLDVDALELEVGFGLVRLVSPDKGGDLLDRIAMIRRQVAVELGIIVPPVRIRDNLQVQANDYAVKVRGQAVARGVVYPDQFLAMDNGATSGPIPGAEPTVEPAFGLPAFWITESQRQQAELLNYTVVEATSVLATHLTEVIKAHAHELLTRQEVNNLLENLKARSPALVAEVVPTVVKVGELQKVLQNLLRERVPVRDLEVILETLGDYAPRTRDLDVLTEYARNALARTICKQHVDDQDRLWCVTLDPALEDLIAGHIERSERGGGGGGGGNAGGSGGAGGGGTTVTNTMPPRTAQQVVRNIAAKTAELTQTGRAAVVLCSPHVRQTVRRMIEGTLPTTAVLAFNEVVPEVSVEAIGMVGING